MVLEGKISTSQFSPPKRPETQHDRNDERSSDKLVWAAFKQGNKLAFVNIYNDYANVLYNYGCQFSPDREMVKDCLQDFFLYLRKNRSGLGDTDSIKLYLLKAFRRRVIDYLKKYNRACHLNESYAFSQFPVELSSESIYINRQIEAEKLEKLNKALQALNSKEREAIYHFYFEGLSYTQIAELFNFTHVSSARRLIYRGLSQLRKFLR